MNGDPFDYAGKAFDRLANLIGAEIQRLWDKESCQWCGLTYVHAHDCLDKMNAQRTPTGDWWKL